MRHLTILVGGILLLAAVGCTRSPAPSSVAAATPAANVIAPRTETLKSEFADDEFRAAPSIEKPILPAGNEAMGKPVMALPVVSTLKNANGETKVRLVGVVGLNSLGKLIDQQGQLKATVVEADGLSLLAVEQEQLTLATGDRRDVLDATEVLRQTNAAAIRPTPVEISPVQIPNPGDIKFNLPPRIDVGPSTAPNAAGIPATTPFGTANAPNPTAKTPGTTPSANK